MATRMGGRANGRTYERTLTPTYTRCANDRCPNIASKCCRRWDGELICWTCKASEE